LLYAEEEFILAEETDVIHVVQAIHDPKGTYSRHSGVVMVSMFERTKSPVCFHILHDDTMTEENRSFLTETAESFGQSIEFHDVSQAVKVMGEGISFAAARLSVGTLFRLAIPDVLPLDRVIYMDSDIIVNLDIRELWDITLEDRSLAGVPDRVDVRPYRRFSAPALKFALIGCDRMTYINAGVLLMNLKSIRERYNLAAQSAEWFNKHGHCADLLDQDMINSCFRGDIKIIASKFNRGYAHNDDISGAILHAAGSIKPWSEPRNKAMSIMYWKTFLKTPWGRLAPDEVVDILFGVFMNSHFTHTHTRQCYKEIFSRLYRDIIKNDVTRMALILCGEMKQRLMSLGKRPHA
jgi:lipopolysaccharide biosynthesis glycosyltransferase